ncbi:MAG: acyl-CoA dehydrogenase family protein [Gemmatimonadetes bacterium]|nr:acyl-CoA dehydrogenase family protein [Gemmatimonadota bacterium]
MRSSSEQGARTVRAFLEDHHLELAERVGAFAAGEIAPRSEPADDAEAREEARRLAGLLGAGGWLVPIGEPDLRACCLIREALAAASPLADAVFALQALGGTPLLLAPELDRAAGEPSERGHDVGAGTEFAARWLSRILDGSAIGAFAMTEPEAGSDAASLTTRAERRGDEYVLNGRKSLISNAGIADVYTVFASTDPAAGSRGISCFLVPAGTEGLRFVGPQVLSEPHPLGEIAFEECAIPSEQRVGPEGRGFKLGMMTLDRLRPTVAAAACGMASRALAEALRHATQRRQFGQLLGDFQLIQEKLGRMAIALDAARLLTYRAAWEKDMGAERITLEASMAKAFATEAAQRIVDDAVQILGGRGVLAESPVDRLYRAVRALRIYEGTTEIQHLIIARHLLEDATTADSGSEGPA